MDRELNKNLTNLWKLDEVENACLKSEDDLLCEKYFEQTYTRDNIGKFIVKIPFKSSLKYLNSSREIALKRFRSLERRLESNLELKLKYVNFMDEYINLGHMHEISKFSLIDDGYFYRIILYLIVITKRQKFGLSLMLARKQIRVCHLTMCNIYRDFFNKRYCAHFIAVPHERIRDDRRYC